MIGWQEAWQMAAIAFGLTFGILFFLSLLTRVVSRLIFYFPGGEEDKEKPASSNLAAGE